MYKREGEETNDLIRLGFFFVKKENIPSDGSFVKESSLRKRNYPHHPFPSKKVLIQRFILLVFTTLLPFYLV